MTDGNARVGQTGNRNFSVCHPTNFLYSYTEPTIEMLRWYYENEGTRLIGYDDIDERTSIVQLEETINKDYIKEVTITIGQNIKRQICRQYMYYHPLVAKNV